MRNLVRGKYGGLFLATHERKFASEIVPSSAAKDSALPLQLTTHSPVSKTNETIARTIKPPIADNKTDRETKVNF